MVFVNTSSASFPFLRKLAGARARRPDRDRFVRAAVRDRVSGILRQGLRRRRPPTSTRTAAVSIWEAFSLRQRRRAAVATIRKGSCRPSVRCSTTPAPASAARPRRPATTARVARVTYLQPDAVAGAARRHRARRRWCSGAPSCRRQLEAAEGTQGIDARRISMRSRAREGAGRDRPRLASDPREVVSASRLIGSGVRTGSCSSGQFWMAASPQPLVPDQPLDAPAPPASQESAEDPLLLLEHEDRRSAPTTNPATCARTRRRRCRASRRSPQSRRR